MGVFLEGLRGLIGETDWTRDCGGSGKLDDGTGEDAGEGGDVEGGESVEEEEGEALVSGDIGNLL